jgi:Beta-lactamase superfamily domain
MSNAAMSVTIEWFGCATFRVRAGELTLFFDTYLDKAPSVPPAGLRAGEVDRADFLFISHAHFDHLYGADIIAKATGATLVGNYESVRLMRANGVPDAQIIATAGGDTVDCGHGITVRALPSQHSGLYAPGSPDSGQDCLGDLGVSAQQRQARTQTLFGRVFTLSDEDRAYFDVANHSTSSYDGGSSPICWSPLPGRCSSRPAPGTGGASSSRSGPTWPSSAPLAAPSWTASPTKAHSPASSPRKPPSSVGPRSSSATTTLCCRHCSALPTSPPPKPG